MGLGDETGIEVGFGAGSILGVGVGDAEINQFESEFADATGDDKAAAPAHPKSATIAIRTMNFIHQILTKKLLLTNHAEYSGGISQRSLFVKSILL